jgi:uncharacterized membrane protein YkvI
MSREVRIVWLILTVLLLVAIVMPAVGFYPLVVQLLYGFGPWLVLLAMAGGIIDAAYHRTRR